MPRGRPPKPTALHALHGTWRKDRHGEMPPLPQIAHDELSPDQARQRAQEIERMHRALGLPERRQDGR